MDIPHLAAKAGQGIQQDSSFPTETTLAVPGPHQGRAMAIVLPKICQPCGLVGYSKHTSNCHKDEIKQGIQPAVPQSEHLSRQNTFSVALTFLKSKE